MQPVYGTVFMCVQEGVKFPGMDQGFGTVKVDNVLVTPTSPIGLVTQVYGEWSPGCDACPKIDDQETIEIKLQV